MSKEKLHFILKKTFKSIALKYPQNHKKGYGFKKAIILTSTG